LATITPLDRLQSVNDRAYDYLKDLILRRELISGQVVTETWLSESLGVSRTPIRLAVSRLVSEGLITLDGRRIQVRETNLQLAIEGHDLRLAIEGYTVRKLAQIGLTGAAQTALAAIAEQIRSLVDDRGDCRDSGQFMKLNRAFHIELANQTGNSLLADETARIFDLFTLIWLSVLTLPGRPQEIIKEHEAILSAIAAKDVEAANAAIMQHVLVPEVFAHFNRDSRGEVR